MICGDHCVRSPMPCRFGVVQVLGRRVYLEMVGEDSDLVEVASEVESSRKRGLFDIENIYSGVCAKDSLNATALN